MTDYKDIIQNFSEVEKLISELHNVIKDSKHSKYDNLFTSISDVHFHENYHSDILCYFFRFEVAKEELINWVNNSLGLKINYEDYKNGEVKREEGRRDITLYSEDKKHAIIIENKSNNAEDQDLQIIRYVKDLKKESTFVDGILYINKYEENKPSYFGQENNSETENKTLITKLLGDNSIETLIDRVLKRDNEKAKVIGEEIKGLFNIIVYGSMNKEVAEIVDKIRNSNVKDEFLKIIETLDEFPKYFTTKYLDDVKELERLYKTSKIDRYTDGKRDVIYIDFFVDKINYAIDIDFFKLQYQISIFRRGSADVEDLKKKYSKEWVFSGSKTNACSTKKRYRTEIYSAFDKKSLLDKLKEILDSFDLKKREKCSKITTPT